MARPAGTRTPMLDQYMAIKSKHPDSILFYRMGDFYEMFYEDAKIASEVLGLRLTSRAHGKSANVPLAGFPYHQLDNYLTRMVKAGQRVVIVEQVEDPKLAKGLVKRDVVQIATVGTNPAAIDEDDPRANRIAALVRDKDRLGLAWADLASGEFRAGEFTERDLIQIAEQISPVELILPEGRREIGLQYFTSNNPPVVSSVEEWICETTFARQTLTDHFGTKGLKGFGIEHLPLAIGAAGALLHYLKGNLRTEVNHFTSLARAEVSGQMIMEATTRRNLELVESLTGNFRATLFWVINNCITSSGKRLLYSRLLSPLTAKDKIEARLDAVQELVTDQERRETFRKLLKESGDLQRYLARLSTGRGSARDLVGILETLTTIPEYQRLLNKSRSELLKILFRRLDPLTHLKEQLERAVADDPPLGINEGGMIREGFDQEIDELRTIRFHGKSWLSEYEQSERTRTGIPKLKVGFNRVFGYFIEITKIHIEKVPDEYIRKQTLVAAERYITPELQQFEERVLNAEEKIFAREKELYLKLAETTLRESFPIQENARVLAELDFLCGLAVLAQNEHYCRPQFEDNAQIYFKDSRHPVVEKLLPPGEEFVPNDLIIGGENRKIQIVTGPNMSGKSTYLRQIALGIILGQMGSFVPASEARIGIVDKLFTRIGALDNLAGGESTFLVEMQETASILHNATSRSLVIFDEVGRGTSTFDGLSLAWAIVEYLHDTKNLRPRTLFATHFHEMVEIEKYLEDVENRNVAVREFDNKVVFLRKIIHGGSDRSFGIHVAQMAGLPPQVISRARDVLRNLEANDLNQKLDHNGLELPNEPLKPEPEPKSTGRKGKKSTSRQAPRARSAQLTFFDPVERQLREALAGVDANNLTPIQALNLIVELKKILD